MLELTGQTLDGQYRIDRPLGRGGMGAVYLAHDTTLNRDVAVKVLHPHLAHDVKLRTRFYQEARLAKSLDHPGIVTVHTYGQDAETGTRYFVMEYVIGQGLDVWLKHIAREQQTVDLAETLTIAQQIAEALHYAHLKGILHRDVKPANVMLKFVDHVLREPGDLPFRPVLTDFGLAREGQGKGLTQVGTPMGTPAYMAPEQCLGREPDPRTDVYSLGVVLYQMVTGRVPFQVRTFPEAARCHSLEPPPPPRTINPHLPEEVRAIAFIDFRRCHP